MSIKIQDFWLSTSRHSHMELLSWCVKHQGNNIRLASIKSSIIPTQLPMTLFTRLSDHLSIRPQYKPSMYLLPKSLLTRRHNSSVNSSDEQTDSQPKDKPADSHLNDKLLHLIKISPKTKGTLIELNSLLISSASSPQESNLLNEYRFHGLEILLLYKKFDWVDIILAKLEGNLNIKDHSIRVTQLALLKNYEKIENEYKLWDSKSLNQLLESAIPILFKSNKKRVALSLWLTLASINHPTFILQSPQDRKLFSTSLNPIVESFNQDVNRFKFIFDFIKEQTSQKNLLYLLAQKFYSKGYNEQVLQLWNITPDGLKSENYLQLMVFRYVGASKLKEAIELAEQYPQLQSEKVKELIAKHITSLKFCSDEHFPTLVQLMKGNKLSIPSIVKIFGKFLQFRKFEQFEELAEIFKSSGILPTVDILNLYMSNALRSSLYGDIIKYLNQIQDIESKPNSDTFLILLKQFARLGDSKSSLALLNLLVERKENLSAFHMNLVLQACVKDQNHEALEKLNSHMKDLNIEPDVHFIENLMLAHSVVNQYDRVKEIFIRASFSPTMKMLQLLLKSLLSQKDFLTAHVVFNAIKEIKPSYHERSRYYLTIIDFFATQGLFSEALVIVQDMRARNIPRTYEHYHTLMSNYNKRGRYRDALTVFNLMSTEGVEIKHLNYRDLLVSLVRTSLINNDNLDNPIAVVDNIIKENQKGNLLMEGKLPFIVIKPLVNALIKHYKPDDAHRIMTNFRIVNPGYEVQDKINYMKQELLLFSTVDKWGSFGVTYENFQNKIRTLLTVDGEAPPNLKKVYSGIIRVIYQYHYLNGDLVKFSKLFHDLIFVHGFTFTSKNLNWISRRLIMNVNTLHDALYIVENRLMGGYIAKQSVRAEKTAKRRQGERYTKHVRNGRYVRPRISLGYIYKPVVEKQVYNYIIGGSGKDLEKRQEKITEMKVKYPRIMKTLKDISKRIKRRDRYFSFIEETYPGKDTRKVIKQIRELKKSSREEQSKPYNDIIYY